MPCAYLPRWTWPDPFLTTTTHHTTTTMNREMRRAMQKKRGNYLMYDPAVAATVQEQSKALASRALAPAVISRPLDEHETLNLRLMISESWEALRTFTGTEHDWRLLAESINDATVRAESISELLAEPLARAAAAMTRMRDRFHAGHRLGPDGEGLQSIPEALAIFDEILINSSPKQMMDAAKEAQRRIDAHLAAAIAEKVGE